MSELAHHAADFMKACNTNLKVGAPTNHTSFSYDLFEMNERPKYTTCVAQLGVAWSVL